MRISAPGNDDVRRLRRSAGFTLIELMVVVALIALAVAVASLALRDPAVTRLEHEAARLAALLEAARAEARAAGLSVHWRPQAAADGAPAGFRFVGLPDSSGLPTRWLSDGVGVEIVGAPVVLLGPEPVIGAQRILLRIDSQQLALVTDGLSPFAVVDAQEDAVR